MTTFQHSILMTTTWPSLNIFQMDSKLWHSVPRIGIRWINMLLSISRTNSLVLIRLSLSIILYPLFVWCLQGVNGQFIYSLEDPSRAFDLDPKSGKLKMKNSALFDREKLDSFQLEVIYLRVYLRIVF